MTDPNSSFQPAGKSTDLVHLPTALSAVWTVLGTDWSVIHVAAHGLDEFNEVFRQEFQKIVPACRYGTIARDSIDLKNEWIRDFVLKALSQLGISPGRGVPAGYYLFAKYEVRAFHPGNFDFNKDKVGLGVGVAIGGLASLFTSDPSVFLRVSARSYERGPAKRMVEFFSKIVAGERARQRERARQEAAEQEKRKAAEEARRAQREFVQRVVNEELESALRLFELDRTATSEDVKRKYRELARKFHPDANPIGKDVAHTIMSQINQAKTVLDDYFSRRVT